LNKEQFNFSKPNPFVVSEGDNAASVGFKYRKWVLGEGLALVARCDVDGAAKTKSKDALLTIKAINEFDLKTSDWRKKIDSQRGAVFATELKNNSSKLAKWAVQAMLAGNDGIKLGFVSRQSSKDSNNHVILAVQDYTPKEFATQINLNIKNTWGSLKRIVEMCMKQPTGKYVLVKDPEKPTIKLYQVPDDSFTEKKSEKKNNDSEVEFKAALSNNNNVK